MRLTKDDILDSGTRLGLSLSKYLKKLEQELLEYKNIEEELGIDLLTLFKALKNGVYYITKTYDLRREYIDITTEYSGSQTLAIKLRIKGKPQLLKQDYGKTWALDKKELEKGE